VVRVLYLFRRLRQPTGNEKLRDDTVRRKDNTRKKKLEEFAEIAKNRQTNKEE
jgi:hypothetical protein